MWWIIEAWVWFSMIVRAAVLVPIGLGLLVLGGWIVLHTNGFWLWLLIAGYFAYLGAEIVFGAVAGFVGPPRDSDPSTRRALRDADMLRRR
jgi:hypothetical protein